MVDDNAVNRQVMALLLEETHAQVRMADCGFAGLELVETEPFDLIFLDIQMPDMDGYETVRRIRAAGHTMPVVAITAHTLCPETARHPNDGMDAWLSKPFKQDMLFRVMRELLPPTSANALCLPAARPVQTSGELSAVAPDTENSPWRDLAPCFSQETIVQTGMTPEGHARVVQCFAQGHGQDALYARRAAADGQWKKLRELAHALKGAARNIGALELGNAARNVELEAGQRLELSAQNPAARLEVPSMEPLLVRLDQTLRPVLLVARAEAARAETLHIEAALQTTHVLAAAEKPAAPTPVSPEALAHGCNELDLALASALPARVRQAFNTLTALCGEQSVLCRSLTPLIESYDYETARTTLTRMSPPNPVQ